MYGMMSQPVGPEMPNRKEDVRIVHDLLERWARATRKMLMLNNSFDWNTELAIKDFQRQNMRMRFPTGVIHPGDDTHQRLESSPHTFSGAGKELQLPPRTGLVPLSKEEYEAAGETLGCEGHVIRAIALQESKGAGFDHQNRPKILYERHLFNKFTNRMYQKTHPDLTVESGGHGPFSVQWKRLNDAYRLDELAALRSTSWGLFQILGNGCHAAGYGNARLFVNAMCQSEQRQLEGFISFVKFSPGLQKDMQNKDWTSIARRYNGPNFRTNHYDTSLEACYEKAKL
jgi:hypothetical protein